MTDKKTLIYEDEEYDVSDLDEKEAYWHLQVRTLRKRIATETQSQPALEVIRQAREELAQQTAANISRKRGNVSLLSSATGGSGFLQGYFR